MVEDLNVPQVVLLESLFHLDKYSTFVILAPPFDDDGKKCEVGHCRASVALR